MQLDAVFLLDKLTDSSATPKKEIHLELLGALVDDDSTNRILLNH